MHVGSNEHIQKRATDQEQWDTEAHGDTPVVELLQCLGGHARSAVDAAPFIDEYQYDDHHHRGRYLQASPDHGWELECHPSSASLESGLQQIHKQSNQKAGIGNAQCQKHH